MIAWVRRVFRLSPPEETVVPDVEQRRHKATLARADRLLKIASDYERADKARRGRR